MTHLSGVDIYGEYFISHLGDQFKDAANLIHFVRTQRQLGQPVDAPTLRLYEEAKRTTKLGRFQRDNTQKINDFITQKLNEEAADASFVSATKSSSLVLHSGLKMMENAVSELNPSSLVTRKNRTWLLS